MLGLLACLLQVSSAPLRVVAKVPLPGGASRFDYQSLDPTTGLLYVSHMGAGRLVVFDTKTDRVAADLPGFANVTGVLAVPEEGRVYASAAGSHEVFVLDAKTRNVLARVVGPRFPDGIAYVPSLRRVFVSDESGRQVLVIDAKTNKAIKTIALGGEAGNSHFDSADGHVWVTVQTRNRMVEIDPKTLQIVGRYDLNGSGGPHGFLIDANDGLAFVSCEENNKLIVERMPSMAALQSFDVTRGPDVLEFDKGLHRLYVGSEGGAIDVFELTGGRLRSLGKFEGPNPHSVAVDQKTHKVYVPIRSDNGKPEMWILEPTGKETAHG